MRMPDDAWGCCFDSTTKQSSNIPGYHTTLCALLNGHSQVYARRFPLQLMRSFESIKSFVKLSAPSRTSITLLTSAYMKDNL